MIHQLLLNFRHGETYDDMIGLCWYLKALGVLYHPFTIIYQFPLDILHHIFMIFPDITYLLARVRVAGVKPARCYDVSAMPLEVIPYTRSLCKVDSMYGAIGDINGTTKTIGFGAMTALNEQDGSALIPASLINVQKCSLAAKHTSY